MEKSYKDFLEQVSQDDALKARLTSIDTTDETAMKQDVLEFAKELGYDLDMNDLSFDQGKPLSDDEVKAVIGGKRSGENDMGCFCPLVGGGGGTDRLSGKTYGCACVGFGAGGTVYKEDTNCNCSLAGYGTDDGEVEL